MTTSSLALRYRPRRFDDLVGQRAVQVVLRQMCLKDEVPAVLLFDGSRGTGKTSTARILAAALNCELRPGPCGSCPSCTATAAGTSPDLIEIDAASNGLVDDIRRLRQQVRYLTTGHRVIVLDEAHMMSAAAFNAALKMLEEPPERTTFILCTTEPHKIPSTVTSRCTQFTFRRVTVADTVARLTHICDQENITVDSALLHLLAERADGGMRNAVMALDQATRVGVATVEQYTELTGETDFAPQLVASMLRADIPSAFAVLAEQMGRAADPAAVSDDLVDLLRDLLVLGCHGTIAKQGAALAARQQLADKLPPPTVFVALKVLWDLKTKARANERSSLDLAVAMLCEVFGKLAAPAPQAPARRLTLAEMAAAR